MVRHFGGSVVFASEEVLSPEDGAEEGRWTCRQVERRGSAPFGKSIWGKRAGGPQPGRDERLRSRNFLGHT